MGDKAERVEEPAGLECGAEEDSGARRAISREKEVN
jgi:hypothetical protein